MSLMAAGFMEMWQGDRTLPVHHAEEALRQFDAAGFEIGATLAHLSLWDHPHQSGLDRCVSPTSPREMFDRRVTNGTGPASTNTSLRTASGTAWPIAQQLGDPWLVAFNLNNFGGWRGRKGTTRQARLPPEAQDYFRRADAVGDQARLIPGWAGMALHDGDMELAEEFPGRAERLSPSFRAASASAECLAGLAAVGAATGRAAWRRCCSARPRPRSRCRGRRWWPADRVEVERIARHCWARR